MCLDARDPYCGWDRKQRRCTTIEDSSNMSQWFQNITACPVRTSRLKSPPQSLPYAWLMFRHMSTVSIALRQSPSAALKSVLRERCYAAWLITSLEAAALWSLFFSTEILYAPNLQIHTFILIYSSWGTKPQMAHTGPGLHGNPVATMTVKAPARVFADHGLAIVRPLAVEVKTARVPPLRCPTAQGKKKVFP